MMGVVMGMSSGERTRGTLALLTPLLAATALSIVIPAGTATAALERTVLGTIVSSSALEVASEPGAWRQGLQGAPILENSELRTEPGKVATVALGEKGIIGVHGGSHLQIGSPTREGLPISLRGESELTFRLPTATDVTFLTDAAIIRGPVEGPAAGGKAEVQGMIAQRGNETIVSVLKGTLRVRNRNAARFIVVGSGEQVTISGPESRPRLAAMTAASKKKTRRIFGASAGLVVAGTTAVAVGAGLGGAAAAGAFDDDRDDENVGAAQGGPGGPPPASPFRP
jgi:hypothetical protein